MCRSHIPAVADDEAELNDTVLLDETEDDPVAVEVTDDDEIEDETVELMLLERDEVDDVMLLDSPVAVELTDDDEIVDVPLAEELLGEDDTVELIVDVAEVNVIVDVVVSVELGALDVADEVPTIELVKLEVLVAEELDAVDTLERELVPEALELDDGLELVIVLDKVVVPDEAVRLLDPEEDEEVIVEDDEAVLNVMEELRLLADVIKAVELDRVRDVDVVLGGTELLEALELCVLELCVLELCVLELCVPELCVVALGVLELCVVILCILELCVLQVVVPEANVLELCVLEVTVLKLCEFELEILEVGVLELCVVEEPAELEKVEVVGTVDTVEEPGTLEDTGVVDDEGVLENRFVLEDVVMLEEEPDWVITLVLDSALALVNVEELDTGAEVEELVELGAPDVDAASVDELCEPAPVYPAEDEIEVV